MPNKLTVESNTKTYVFDIDGTICRTKNGDYRNAKPLKNRIRRINVLWSAGNKIIYYTSRGALTKKKWRKLTEKQFKKWGVKYSKLYMNKPYGDWYIDDHNITIKDFFK